MKKIEATNAPRPRSEVAIKVAWLYAACLVVMAVGQLFSFEKFIPLISEYRLPGDYGTATLVACLIVVVEVFALPFLLRMRLSPLMRWVSMACGILAATVWVKLSIWSLAVDNLVSNSGILGTKVAVPAGFIALATALTLLVLAAWSAWGLWPSHTPKK